jgi:hypothetical protein
MSLKSANSTIGKSRQIPLPFRCHPGFVARKFRCSSGRSVLANILILRVF